MAAVSVVIPLFNKKAYIERCLASVCRQTARDFEAIVVDDGSTDGSGDVAAAFPDRRVRVIRQENGGPGAARNRGIREAQGELVAFLDADDEWLPAFLECILELRSKYPRAGILAVGYRRCRGRDFDTEITVVPPRHGYHRLIANYLPLAIRGNLVTSSSSAIVRSVLTEVGGFSEGERFGEDRDLWVRISLQYPVAVDVRILAIYHSEAEGRACQERPATPAYPPAARSLRRALAEGAIPADRVSDVQTFIDVIQMQYFYWQLDLRDRASADRLLRQPYFTSRFRSQAAVWRALMAVLPMRVVQGLRLKPQNTLRRIQQIPGLWRTDGVGEIRRYGDLVIRQVRPDLSFT